MENRPNQSLEPMARSVTRPAGAGRAPALTMAHHLTLGVNPLVDRLSGKSLKVAGLEAVYLDYCDRDDLVRWAISAMDHLDREQIWYSLWLLRRAARDGASFEEADLRRLFEMADGYDHWVARLTFCQTMAAVKIPESLIKDAFSSLEPFTRDRLAIVRAWAISAVYPFKNELSVGSKIRSLVTRLKKERSKAMQARLRRLQNA